MRSTADIHNPLLNLPAAQRVSALQPEARSALKALLLDMREQAKERAQIKWDQNKPWMATYYKVMAVYLLHMSRLCRDPKKSTDEDVAEPATYPTPAEGWNCFHCGEHFPPHSLGRQRAEEHFGDYAFATPACQLWEKAATWRSGYRRLVRALRAAEKDRNETRRQLAEDDTEKDRQIYRLQSDHSAALMRAEEAGYAKGLRDGRAIQAAE